MIAAPPPPLPPAVHQPAPRQASFGLVSGVAPAGTRRIVVRVGGRVAADRPLRGRRFSLRLDLPPREVTVGVTAHTATSARTTWVTQVLGLPRAARPRATRGTEDARLARALRARAGAYPGTSAMYVKDLGTGRGAAWNAGARFPAASTLKLAIAVTLLRRHTGLPAPGTRLAELLRRMLVDSDNEAANALESWIGGGSLFAGAAVVNKTMWGIGMRDSHIYGGYASRAPSGSIPVRAEQRPAFGVGKYTTARDLALLAESLFLAADAKGPLVARYGGAFTPADARHLLWILSRTADRGKLDRFQPDGTLVFHKAGWLAQARHDSGIVVWRGGVFVAAVLTWRPSGAGLSADVLAGRVAADARSRLS